jgi:hypothetical protein
MTATAPPPSRVPAEPSAEALARAGELLARTDLWLYRNVTTDQARQALARALDRDGPDSPHAAFLAEALRRRSKTERRRGPRPDPQRIARRLIEQGAAPPRPRSLTSSTANRPPPTERPASPPWSNATAAPPPGSWPTTAAATASAPAGAASPTRCARAGGPPMPSTSSAPWSTRAG